MKDLGLIDLRTLAPEAIAGLRKRRASRAVVFDGDDRVALLHVTKKNYFKLPGGGIEEGEDEIAALMRECLEEIGCHIEVRAEIGSIRELRGSMDQTSYCYVAHVVGPKGSPAFTPDELEEGFCVQWTPIDDAIELVGHADAVGMSGEFIRVRDAILLREAREIMGNSV